MVDFKYKQVIAIRTDLKMSKGKLAVQVAHASISSFIETNNKKRDWTENWLAEGQKKVVVRAKNLDELFSLKNHAERLDIPCALITDAGLTELEPGTITALGMGPAPAELIDKVTGELKLL